MDKLFNQLKEELLLNDIELDTLKYLYEHRQEIPTLSTRTLAMKLNTHPMLIIRLGKKLGYSSYLEFKYHIISFLDTYFKKYQILVQENGLSIKLQQMKDFEKAMIDETFSYLNFEEVQQIIIQLQSHLYIDIVANDANADLARFFAHHFSAIGKIVNIYDAVDLQIFLPHLIDQQHMIIFMTKQEDSPYLLDIALALKNKNVITLLLGTPGNKKLSRLCHYTLWTAYHHEEQLGNFIYHTSCKYLLDILFVLMYFENNDQSITLEKLHVAGYKKRTSI